MQDVRGEEPGVGGVDVQLQPGEGEDVSDSEV